MPFQCRMCSCPVSSLFFSSNPKPKAFHSFSNRMKSSESFGSCSWKARVKGGWEPPFQSPPHMSGLTGSMRNRWHHAARLPGQLFWSRTSFSMRAAAFTVRQRSKLTANTPRRFIRHKRCHIFSTRLETKRSPTFQSPCSRLLCCMLSSSSACSKTHPIPAHTCRSGNLDTSWCFGRQILSSFQIAAIESEALSHPSGQWCRHQAKLRNSSAELSYPHAACAQKSGRGS